MKNSGGMTPAADHCSLLHCAPLLGNARTTRKEILFSRCPSFCLRGAVFSTERALVRGSTGPMVGSTFRKLDGVTPFDRFMHTFDDKVVV